MHYKIEILTKTVDKAGRVVEIWRAMRPSNGSPYVFDTLKEAESIFDLCYPRGSRARIDGKVKITKYEN